RLLRRHLCHAGQEVAECGERRRRALRQQTLAGGVYESGPQRVVRGDWLKAGEQRRQIGGLDELYRLERFHHALADAAGGDVDHAPEADVVVWVEHQLQIRERVLDLLALVEPYAADDLV